MDLKTLWRIHDNFELPSLATNLLGGNPNYVPTRYSLTSLIELIPINSEQIYSMKKMIEKSQLK